MIKPGKAEGRWTFSLKVLVPVLVAIVTTMGTAAGFMMWSTTKSDERALQRETRLVGHILANERQAIVGEMREATHWDEAVEHLNAGDLEWVDEEFGPYFYDLFNHNRIYVLDANLNPVYAMREGGRVDVATFAPDRETIAALAAEHRTAAGASAIAANDNGFGEVPVKSDITVVEGFASLVAVIPVLAESYIVPAGEEFFVASVRFLDDAAARELMEHYLIEGARFTSNDALADGETALPLNSASGQPVAWFKWQPDRPGATILAETAPALTGMLAAVALVIFVLIQRLRRSSSELEAARAEAQHRALHDPLTGLANRAGFQERLTQAIAGLGHGPSAIALLALDLDRFKQVNDTLGHEAGDLLLKQVAERLRPLLRDSDFIARLGGDEFAIIQSALATIDDAKSLSARVVARISEPYSLNGQQAQIGVSIGIAVAGSPEDGVDLPSRADFALYEAKEAGRNQARLFGEKRDDRTPETGAATKVA
jgi:diguanylate cyclase (GGDEF)-like protein